MPILSQVKPKTIPYEAIQGLKQPLKKTVDVSRFDKQDNDTYLNNLLQDNLYEFNPEELIIPIYQTHERFTTINNYNPLIPNSADFSIEYGVHSITGDLKVTPFRYKSGLDTLYTKFVFTKAGVYSIKSNIIVATENASATRITVASLKLHKNGVLYSTYWTHSNYVVFPSGANWYFPAFTLHVDEQIRVDVSDYIEIVFNYENLAGDLLGLNNDSVTSILNINYEGI